MFVRVLAVLSGAFCYAMAADRLELKDGEVVAFVGGTDLVRMQNDGRFEAALTERFIEKKPKFRDFSWEGDTVSFQSTVRERWRSKAFGDWSKQLRAHGVTTLIVQFGKIESLAGADGLKEFEEDYGKLLDQLGAEGRNLVLIEPFDFEWAHADGSSLNLYRNAVRGIAEKRGVLFLSRDQVRELQNTAIDILTKAVQEKHRLWYDYWRPANWKCLFGDDSKRVFSNAAEGLPSFKEEWKTFPALIAAAEEKVWKREVPEAKPNPLLTGSEEADIEKELASFELLEGYEVNLFADEGHGIANPLAVRWDADGRMFVACSDAYPQIEPGVKPNDKVIMLCDTNRDGVADESEVFADGLSVPTGLEVGGDGVYVAHNTKLEFFDWDGERKLLLSGFGNGDSHQTSNGMAWSPDGDLWFSQGDGIESRVETPFGVSSLFQAGVFRLRPDEFRLDPLLDDFMGPGNPWGVGFDDYGQSFVIDGAGGISYLTPASVPVHRRLRLPRIGKPGGYCGIDQLGDGSFGIGDYKKNQVTRFRASEDGAGFKVDFLEPLMRSSHRNFRPIDVKLGPDGAFYIVDWYNPITCHQDDFYRHPDRDKTHGRIWRVAKKNVPSREVAELTKAPTGKLIELLKLENRWTRTKAKQVLAARGLKALPEDIYRWKGRDLLEALGLAVWCGLQDRRLLEQLQAAEDHRCRAYAARIAGRWRLHDLLEAAASDKHPRVRMEAILAAGQIPAAESVLVIATAVERPRDRWIDYAFKQAVHYLKPYWVSAFLAGELDFEGRRKGLSAVLGEADSKALLNEVRSLLRDDDMGEGVRVALTRVLLMVGGESDLELALSTNSLNPELLGVMALKERPGFDVVSPLRRILKGKDQEAVFETLKLARHWRVRGLRDDVLELISTSKGELRKMAIRAYGTLAGSEGLVLLKSLAGAKDSPDAAALGAILEIDLLEAARIGSKMLRSSGGAEYVRALLGEFVAREGAARALAAELEKKDVDAPRARFLYEQWIASGLFDVELSEVISQLAGVEIGGYEFSESLAKELARLAKEKGDRVKGEALFHSQQLGCAACHQLGEEGGTLGPDLSAVGSGVPPERIVTEVLWPDRQVKAGFVLNSITLNDNRVFHGYVKQSRDENQISLFDFVTRQTRDLSKNEIKSRDSVGSLMPETAQSLTREQVADLVAYLIGLRR